MKKKLSLNKKTIKNLKLKLKAVNERKVAPVVPFSSAILADPSNGNSC